MSHGVFQNEVETTSVFPAGIHLSRNCTKSTFLVRVIIQVSPFPY